jgi:hypothetical protein
MLGSSWRTMLLAPVCNNCSGSRYTDAGIVTDTEAEELVKAARQFAAEAEAWIKAKHPPPLPEDKPVEAGVSRMGRTQIGCAGNLPW